MEVNKRARSSNWTEQEKKVLRKLVLEKASIIENKETSSNMNSAKKIAWEEVALRFNAVSTYQRDITQLQCQWRNFKNRAKKAEYSCRPARLGPPAEERELMEAFTQEFTVIESNNYDSDGNNSQPNITRWTQITPSSPTSGSMPGKRPKPKKLKSNCSCSESHEHQLFQLAKKAREETMLRDKEAHEYKMKHEKELHEMRTRVISLEEDYWKNKIFLYNNK